MEFIKIKQPTFEDWHKKNFKLDRVSDPMLDYVREVGDYCVNK